MSTKHCIERVPDHTDMEDCYATPTIGDTKLCFEHLKFRIKHMKDDIEKAQQAVDAKRVKYEWYRRAMDDHALLSAKMK